MRGLPGTALLVIYVAVALLPLGLAWMQGLPARPWRDELSSAMAMVGYAMLLMEFVISGRFQLISGRIGIDVSMRFHRFVAHLLAVLLLLHPWLYTLPMGDPRPWDTAGTAALGLQGASVGTGWAAWMLLILLVAWASFRRDFGYRYEAWRVCHGVGAMSIALLGLHHALQAGRYSAHDLLAGMWLVMVALAAFTLLQVYVIGPLRQLRKPYRVVSVEPVALRTWKIALEPERGEAMEFEAGQFVWLSVNRSPFTITEHPFSMSSCPADRPRIAFTIKEVGDFTSTVGQLPVGAPAYLDGPHGGVGVGGRAGTGIALIAGGVGLAPIISILREAHARGEPRPLRLIYGNRAEEQILYRDEIDDMASELDLEVFHVLGQPPPGWAGITGTLDETVLDECLGMPDRDRWLYVICGPAPMIDDVEASLESLGVPRRQMISEKFSHD